MKRKYIAICAFILLFFVMAKAQPPAPRPAPERSNGDLMVGDWTMEGTAKDSPTKQEYRVAWKLHGSRILGGSFVQVDQTWKGNGPEEHSLEIVSYNPAKETHASYGFSDDGSVWVGTATYNSGTVVETGVTTTADGKNSKWRGTYIYSPDGMAVSGTEESEQAGAKWTSFTVKGTKSHIATR